MKRLVALALCFCLILCGCAPASSETATVDTNTATESVGKTETFPQLTVAETTAPVSGNASIAETVIFDNGDFKLTAKEIDFSDNYDVKVKILAENNTDKTVSILGNYFSINGITMYCSFYIELAPGKKANDFIEIRKDDLACVGIEEIATIQANDTYIYDKDISKKITDFKFRIETSATAGYQQEVDKSGQTVYDQNGIVIKYRGIIPGTYDGEELDFYIENNSDLNLTIHADDVSVNGFMIYGSMVAHAYSGCVTYETLDFSSSDLEENDIETIEEVTFSLYGYDQDANKKVWETEEVTVRRNEVISSPASETPPEEENATRSGDTSMESVVYVLDSTLKKNYDSVSVTYEGSTIDINLSYPGLASAAQNAKSSNDKKQLDAWDSFVASLKKTNSAALDIAIDAGFSDATVILNFRNDLNPENILLIIMNDTVIYDVVNSK